MAFLLRALVPALDFLSIAFFAVTMSVANSLGVVLG
jgi:hypothetical protein